MDRYRQIIEHVTKVCSFFCCICRCVPFRFGRALSDNWLTMRTPVDQIWTHRNHPASSRPVVIVRRTIVGRPRGVRPHDGLPLSWSVIKRGVTNIRETIIRRVLDVSDQIRGSLPVRFARIMCHSCQRIYLIRNIRSRRPREPEQLSDATAVRFGFHESQLLDIIRRRAIEIRHQNIGRAWGKMGSTNTQTRRFNQLLYFERLRNVTNTTISTKFKVKTNKIYTPEKTDKVRRREFRKLTQKTLKAEREI